MPVARQDMAMRRRRSMSCFEKQLWIAPRTRSTMTSTHLLPDLLPDDPRHLVSVQLNDRVLYDNLVLCGDPSFTPHFDTTRGAVHA